MGCDFKLFQFVQLAIYHSLIPLIGIQSLGVISEANQCFCPSLIFYLIYKSYLTVFAISCWQQQKQPLGNLYHWLRITGFSKTGGIYYSLCFTCTFTFSYLTYINTHLYSTIINSLSGYHFCMVEKFGNARDMTSWKILSLTKSDKTLSVSLTSTGTQTHAQPARYNPW